MEVSREEAGPRDRDRDGFPSSKKVYEVFLDENGKQIEWHYWINPDGTLDGGKIVFPGTTGRVGLAE